MAKANQKADEAKTKIAPDTDKYVTSRAASGAKSLHTNDTVAIALDGLSIDQVKQVAGNMGVEEVNKYDHLNPGQIRMNLGNRIRGTFNKAEREKEGSGQSALTKAMKGINKVEPKKADKKAA